MSAGRLSRVAVTVATVLSWAAVVDPEPAPLSLGEIEVTLLGLTADVDPADPIVPKETASGLRIVVKAGGRTLSSPEVERLLGGSFEVRAELSGPGLPSTLSLPLTGADAVPSPDPLVLTFPGLPSAGDYDIANVRLVRGGRPVLDVQPRRTTLRVIDQILVTSVVTRPLTLDEIRERGVVLDSSAYLGFEFAITLQLESEPVRFVMPVVFDRNGVPIPVALEPPPEPLRSVLSAPQFVPVLLRPKPLADDPDGAPPPTYSFGGLPLGGARIPSLLVIPGSVGYLKQFFSAQLMVGNGAPQGSGLVVRDVTGHLALPPGADGAPGTEDDPLALPALESGPQSPLVEVLGEHGSSSLLPGEFGRAELTLRGEREGRHDIDFEIEAVLDGLPVGPVPLEGRARGVVLVKNAYFDVTFSVPTVVRADEEFSLFATVTNIGQGVGQDVKVTLDGARLSGAHLLSSGTQTIDRLPPADSQTLEYRLRSQVTGEVVASYLRFDTSGGVDVTGRLNFYLAVGDRGVTTSPDTLVLPAAAQALPEDIVRAAMRVLGQAWSAARATVLPPGVERPSTEAVFQKGLAVAEAGLRVQLGQPLPQALRDLLLDFHGGLFDAGFDQTLRETSAGRDFDRVLGFFLEETVAGDGLLYEEDAAEIAASGPPFLSFAAESPGGGVWPAEVGLLDAVGRRTDLEVRGVPTSVLVALGSEVGAPRLGWVSSLAQPPYQIQIDGTDDGVVDLSLTVPGAGGEARHVRLSGITVQAGTRARVVWDPIRSDDVDLEIDLAGDGVYEQQDRVTTTALGSLGPQLVSAATIGPETLEGATPFGTYAALLFDRVVSASDAADLSSYEIERNSVVAARRQLSGRLVFVALGQPEGPLVPTQISIQGIHDERGAGGTPQEQPLTSRLILPGAVVSGRVLEAGGAPVGDALVTYHNVLSSAHFAQQLPVAIAAQRTDAAGRFAFRYVSQDPSGSPFRLETNDPTTGALRGVKAYVRAHGQSMVQDLVLIGHGTVTGAVVHADGRLASGARVRVVSVTDSQVGILTTADDQGAYSVEGMTVGAVTVTAVSGANLGRGAGRLDVAGSTTTVNVTLDGEVDFTGIVQKLEDGVLTPVPGVDVVYYREGTPLGVSVTDSLGQYRLWGVPAGSYRLEAGLNTRDKASVTGNSVAGQSLVQNLVIEIRDYSNYGTVRGTVRRIDGSPVLDAWVSDNVVATAADSLGQYELAGVALSASPRSIKAVSPDGQRSGSTSVVLTVPGQIAEGADIELSGQGAVVFQVLDAQGASVEGASVGLQGSCLHPCGCRFSNTDDQGLARFADVGFGTVRARAVVQGLAGRWDSALGTAAVTSEDIAGGGLIRLDGFGTVTVSVANPDGAPAHGASVELKALSFVNAPGVCGLQYTTRQVYTDEAGNAHFEDVHVGAVSAQASSMVFPRIVGGAGNISAEGANAQIDLRLVDTMAGVLSGTIWLPDGSAGAGPGVEVTVNGPTPDVTVHTLTDGRFEFAPVLPAGGYWLTVRDTRPAGTGSVARTRIYLQPAQDAQHDLRLKASGPVHVTVVDGGDVPVEDAVVQVRLVESDFPNRRFEGTIDGPGSQPLVFPEVFEGEFAVHVSDNFARGGRSNGTVPPDGQPAEVKVRLTTTGTVVGRFLWADAVSPLPLGTVRLLAGGRVIGQQTTLSEGDIGSYVFDYVPAGAIRLEAEDPVSGRTGITTGDLTSQGEVLSLDVVAHSVGRVEGDVTLNDGPAPGADVSLSSGRYRVRVTADAEGRYAVEGVPEGQISARADLGSGFLAGSATGTLSEEGQILDLPIALKGAGTIEGQLFAAGGSTPGAPAVVTLLAGGRRQTTTTDGQGLFRFDLVPEGAVTLTADALASIDCARESLSVAGGETLPVTLELLGVGAVEGRAASSVGPVGGNLTVTGTGPGCAGHRWTLSVGPSGQFRIPELLAGAVSASFRTSSTSGPPLYASGSDTVLPGETSILDLLVEPSGHVQGTVVHEDGTPAVGSEVRISAGNRRPVVHSGAGGAFLAEGIPVGPITLAVKDAALGGVAIVEGLTVAENTTLAAGEIQLIETPLGVTAVVPGDGAIDVAVAQPLQMTLNAPLAGAWGLRVTAAGQGLGVHVTLSTDRQTVTFTPWASWPDSRELVLEAGVAVTDVYGRRLAAPVASRFRTVDLSPPKVLSVAPAHGAIEVDSSATVTVLFDELLATGGDLQPLVQLDSVQGSVAGTVASADPSRLSFVPAQPLASNTTYTVTVNGVSDLLGHVQTAAFKSTFMTPDSAAPILQLQNPTPNGWTSQRRPTIRVTVTDGLAGPDTSAAEMRLDGQDVAVAPGSGQFSHVPPAELSDGTHTVEASAHDRAGNRGDLVASFHVDTQPPSTAVVTAPVEAQVLTGEVPLSGTASDAGSGVTRLDFFRDGVWIADALAPDGLSASWNTAGSADGPYLITARAVDAAGNPGPKGAAAAVVVNNVPLAVSLTAPAEGLSAKTQVAVAATPSEPVSRMEFRAGAGPVVTDDTVPYEAVLDLTSEPEGEVTLTVTAIGLAPETSTVTRTIFVDRTPPPTPDPTRVHAEATDTSALVVGVAGAVELGSHVDVTNPSRGAANQRMSFTDGSFAMRVAGATGETVAVTATDEAGNTSDPLALTITESPTSSIPLGGLALWARPGEGLTVDGDGRVSQWSDQSGAGNDLVQPDASDQPVLAEDPVSGMNLLRFDGSDDWMQFTAGLSGTIRAVFAVLSEDENPWPQRRAFLAEESTIDFYGGAGVWWYYNPPYASTSLSIVNGQTWVNGVAIDGRTTDRPNALSVASVLTTDGVRADRLFSGPYSAEWQGDIAELIIYTEPLTDFERKSVEDYLALKYASYVATAGAPALSPNGGTFDATLEVSLASPTPAAEIRYTLDGSEPTETSDLYAPPLVLTQTTTVRARAFRSGMNPSPVTVASFTESSDFSPASVTGLALWVRADAGLTADGMGRVSRWSDQSASGNDLTQSTLGSQPLVRAAAPSGLPVLRFDGSDDWMPFTAGLSGTIRAVFAVLSEDAGAATQRRAFLAEQSTIDFYGGAGVWWYYNPPYASTSLSIVNGQTWVNGLAIDGRTTDRPNTLSVVSVLTTGGVRADRLFSGPYSVNWQGDIAELIIYTEPLTNFERKSVEDYLALKYAVYVPTAGAPEFSPNGGTFEGSLEVSLASPTPDAEVRYTLDGSEPTETSQLYANPLVLTETTTVRARAYRSGMNPSPVALASFTNASFSPASVAGLALWVRGDAGLTADGIGRVSRWSDQSASGNDLTQSTLGSQPLVQAAAPSGLPALRFDGSDDWMPFTAGLSGTIRAVFAVLSEDAGAATQRRAFLAEQGTIDFYGGAGVWWYYNPPYASTSLSILNGQTFINGIAIDGRTTDRPHTLSIVSVLTTGGLSADRLFDGPYSANWQGEIAELIIYTEPPTSSERKSVEDYLALKYAVTVPAGAPEFSPNGGVFEGSVEVSLSSPTPGAEIRYTLDGSEPTETSLLYLGPFVLTESTTVKARAYRAAMDPSPVALASFTGASDFSPASVSGLGLWLRGDSGVTADGIGRVSEWQDQSGLGRHLVQTAPVSQPLSLPGELNGLPVLRFDGSNDWLGFTERFDKTIRAAFMVLSCDANTRNAYLLGDESTTDFYPGYNSLWHGSSTSQLILQGQTWLNGVPINGTATTRPTEMSVLSVLTEAGATEGVSANRLFANASGAGAWYGDIAELIVYTEPLTDSERKSLEDYLALKYAPYVATAGAPEFSPNGGTFETSIEVSLASPTPGAEIRYTLDGSEPDEMSALYVGAFVLTETTVVEAQAYHPGMDPSPVAVSSFVRSGDLSPAALPGLGLWVSAGAGVVVDASSDRVSIWRDLSGNGNDLVQTSLDAQPLLVPDAVAGQPALRLDGTDDVLLFSIRLTDIRSVFWVLRADPAANASYRFLLGDSTTYNFHSGATSTLWHSSYASAAIRDGETRINGSIVDGRVTSRPTSMSLISLVTTGSVTADAFSRDRTSAARSWWGDLAELIIYDRPLESTERTAVEDYLALKYALYVPTLEAPVFTPNGSTTVAQTHVTISGPPGAAVYYTTDGSEPTETSTAYEGTLVFDTRTTVKARAFRAGSNPSPVVTATFLDGQYPTPNTVAGLKLWVKADAGVSAPAGFVSTWADQSGNGNDLVQATTTAQPLFVSGEVNGLPVVRFDGASGAEGDVLHFTDRLTGIRTVFWVIRAEDGDTGYRFLLGDASKYDFHSGSGTQIWNSGYTSVSIKNGETRLNGAIINGTTTGRPTSPSVISLVTTGNVTADAFSRDRTSTGRSWRGDLAELVIYDRPLSVAERELIESYLAAKYALYVPPVAAPVVAPAGGRVSGTELVQLDSATPGATIRLTIDDTEPTESSPAYSAPLEITDTTRIRARAFLPGGGASDEVVVTFLGDGEFTPASVPSLALWVRADAGVGSTGVARWADQGGADNALVQPNPAMSPEVVLDGVSRMPLLHFDGVDDTLLFTKRQTAIRTVFWVVRTEVAASGYHSLLGDSSTYHFLSDSTTRLWGGYTSALIRNGETRLSGDLVDGTTTDRPTSLSVISLVTTGDVIADAFSRDRTYGRSWSGDLAELVIYDRALSPAEIRSVEEFLAGRYSLGLVP